MKNFPNKPDKERMEMKTFFVFLICLVYPVSAYGAPKTSAEISESEIIIELEKPAPLKPGEPSTAPVPLEQKAAGQEPENAKGDFRKAFWGMSKDEVRATERAKLKHQTNDALFFEDRLAGIDIVIIYTFHAGKLTTGAYMFEARYVNHQTYIDDFRKIDGLLEKKYGKGIAKERQIWTGSSPFSRKNDPSDWPLAISTGHLKIGSKWETKSTTIGHFLAGEKFIEINHGIMYSDKSAEGKILEEKEKSDLTDF